MNSPGLFLIGKKHTIELTIDEEGNVDAQCRGAQASFQSGKNWCDWHEKHDTLRDATEYAQGHADGER
jgi:hypothetical protein